MSASITDLSRVLLVTADDDFHRETLHVLTRAGYMLVTAETLIGAVHSYLATLPDVVLIHGKKLDTPLSVVVETLRRVAPHPPIVVVESGLPVDLLLDAGVNEVFSDLPTPSVLLDTMHRHLWGSVCHGSRSEH